MKLSLIVVYATLLFYANLTFSHERQDLKALQKLQVGSLKNIIINTDFKQVVDEELLTLNETTKQINFGKNKVTLVNFWATWCAPCREEMPSLNRLVESVASDNFSVLAIAVGRNSNNAINKFFSQHNLTNLESYKDPKGRMSSHFSVLGLPTTIIIDQHSYEIAKLLGGTEWDSNEAVAFINKILEHGN